MSSWQRWLLVVVLGAGIVVAAWFVSASVTRKRLLAEWPHQRDTVTVIDTLWREVVRIKTLPARMDTLWVYVPAVDTSNRPESLYIAIGDTISDRFALHIEYAQMRPLHESGAFQNVRLDIRDSVRTVTVTERVVDVREEWPIPWMIAGATVVFGLGVWAGSR